MDDLKPFALLGGKNAEELWPALNVILLTWGLLAFAPRYKHTPMLTLVAPIIMALMYTLMVISMFMDGGGSSVDFSSLEGVVC